MKNVVLIRSNPVSPDPPVEKVANTLIKSGYSVIILAWDRNNSYFEKKTELNLSNGKVSVISFGIPAKYGSGFKTLKKLFLFQVRIGKWLFKNKNIYDFIHAFDFDTGFIAKYYAKKYNKKFIYHILDFYIDSHLSSRKIIRKIIKLMEFSVINNSDITIICTDKRIEQIKGSNPKNLIVIHNSPPELLDFNKDFKIKGDVDKIKIVYVGVLGEGRFIKEIAEVVSTDNRLEFHIGGYGYFENEILNYSKKYSNIFFYGKLKYLDTLTLESKCDIMVAIYDPNIPNHKYSAPNKFYESLMIGKPIIMSKNTGYDDIINDNAIGYLIDYSTTELKICLESVLDNIDKWSSLKSKKIYYEKYSWEIMEKKLISEYDNIK